MTTLLEPFYCTLATNYEKGTLKNPDLIGRAVGVRNTVGENSVIVSEFLVIWELDKGVPVNKSYYKDDQLVSLGIYNKFAEAEIEEYDDEADSELENNEQAANA